MTIHVPPQYPHTLPTKLMFVGEAPSTEELEKGIPMVGPSGRIYNSMMRTANLDRRDYMVTNVFDEKLPDNDVARWCVSMQEARAGGFASLPPIGSKGYLKPEYHWHLERLRQEIMDVKPNVVVPLGGTALWAFTGFDGITGYRGNVAAATRIVPGIKIFPTFHPAFVMHQWKFYTIVVGDFIKAAREAENGPDIVLPHKALLLEPTLADIEEYMPRLLASDLLSVDIETGWGQITDIGFAPDASSAISIPFVDKRSANRNYWATPDIELKVWMLVKQVMESGVPKLGQNFAGYDAYWFLEKMGIEPRNLLHDTRLLHHALYPELPKDLQFLGASYTNQGMWKSWAAKKKEKKDD